MYNFKENYTALLSLANDLNIWQFTILAYVRMIAFTVINDFNHQGLTNHNIIGLEVEMNYITLFEIPCTLDNHEQNIHFGEDRNARTMKIEVFHNIRHEELI